MHSFAAFAPADRPGGLRDCAGGSEVFVISAALAMRGKPVLPGAPRWVRIMPMPRNHPVAQPGSHRAAGQIQRKHDQAEVEPIAGAAGDHARERRRDQRRRQPRQPARRHLRYALAAMDHRDPAHGETQQQRRQQPAPVECRQICHSRYLTTKSMRRFCALPSSVSLRRHRLRAAVADRREPVGGQARP